MTGLPDSDGTTSKAEYAPYLLRALKSLGGSASEEQLIEAARGSMRGVLLPGDLKLLYGGRTPRWMNSMEQMLDGLVEEGYIRRGSGGYALTEKGRASC